MDGKKVTGETGFIESHLGKMLLQRGNKVIVESGLTKFGLENLATRHKLL